MKLKSLLLVFCLCFLTACSTKEKVDDGSVDYDLTEMSSTMVYSQIFDLVQKPDKYDGDRFKVEGQLMLFDIPNTEDDFYSIIISDATLCCAQGVEISFDETIVLPAIPSEVLIEGVVTVKEVDGIELPVIKLETITNI